MNRTILVTLAVLLCFSLLVNGGKILLVPADGSHWLNMKIFAEELHSRGHEITVLIPSNTWYIKPESSHYKSIVVNYTFLVDETSVVSFQTNLLKTQREDNSLFTKISNLLEQWKIIHTLGYSSLQMAEEIFKNTTLMQSLRDTKYDLLLTDPMLPLGVFLGHHLGLPLVLDVKWLVYGDSQRVIAPSPLSFVPVIHTEMTDKMTFIQRVINFVVYLCQNLIVSYFMEPNFKPFIQHYFGNDMHFKEFLQTADIWLMRSDITLDFPRPTMPNIIYVSGFQCKPPKALSKEMEDFIQSSGEHGIIVTSFGTLVKTLPEDIAEDMAAAFAQLPQKVIWKYLGKRPSTLGNNTLLLEWLPQNDLLGHPKTRAFVTHGGLNGVEEAIYHGIPMVSLPITWDQPDNSWKVKVRGVAKILDYATLNKDDFLEALKDVLYEPSYREKMKMLSILQRDHPIKPLDHAIFWIEFVMRHKGASHLRTEASKMSIIQYYSIDVIAFLLAVSVMVITVSSLAIRYLWRRVLFRSKVKKE